MHAVQLVSYDSDMQAHGVQVQDELQSSTTGLAPLGSNLATF